jgi:hypothetical protein
MGTPPRPSDSGESFTLRRSKALSGTADDMLYIEFSADDDAGSGRPRSSGRRRTRRIRSTRRSSRSCGCGRSSLTTTRSGTRRSASGKKSLRHRPDDEELNTAVDGAQQKRVGDRFRWDRQTPGVDVEMLEAVTLAAWGADMDDDSDGGWMVAL